MTREEREAAISYLETYRKIDEELFKISPQNSVAHHAAAQCLKYWDMAIEALKQEPILDKIRAEIQENINYNKKMNYQGIAAGLLLARDIIDSIRAKSEDKE